jgi:hypothetical protein
MKRMKQLLYILLCLFAIHSYGQTTKFQVQVTPFADTVCHGGKIAFIATPIDSIIGSYTFKWLFKGVEIPDSARKFLVIKNITVQDTGYYQCICSDTNRLAIDTSNPAYLRMRAQLHVDTLYRYNPLGCPSDSNGQMKILVSGGNPPYTYVWSGGSFHQLDTLGVGFPRGTYTITVTDSDTTHCVTREFTIEALKLHKIIFHKNTIDTVYLSNPGVTVAMPDTCVQHLDNWNWDFGDNTTKAQNLNPCEHNYAKIGEFFIKLNFTDNISGQLCDSTIIDTIWVKTIRLFIPNVITPGSGDDNGSLKVRELDETGTKPKGSDLDLSEVFLSTQMFIFNRQGRKVYEKTNFRSGDWDGDNLSSGVYYYILKCHGANGDEVYKGSVTILRK